jgi:small basic protein
MIPLIGLLVGIILGLAFEPNIPQALQPYLPIAIIAAMDALFGAFRAYLEGTFTDRVFVVSFISNVLISAAIVYVGDRIGVGSQLATAVVVVLGIRIFTNAAAIRRALFRA